MWCGSELDRGKNGEKQEDDKRKSLRRSEGPLGLRWCKDFERWNFIKELRNQAVGAGADTVLITSSIFTSSGAGGLAYRCKEAPPQEAMK